MGLLDMFRREKAAQTISGGSLYAGAPSSSRGNDREAPLRAYGENVWLYATVSRTAEAVAETQWTLYKKNSKGEREAIEDDTHPLKVLLNKPNQSESGHDLLSLNQTYIELCAKSYIIYQNNELHIAPCPLDEAQHGQDRQRHFLHVQAGHVRDDISTRGDHTLRPL